MASTDDIRRWLAEVDLPARLAAEVPGDLAERLRGAAPAGGESTLRRTLARKLDTGRFPPDFERAMLDTERLNQQASSYRAAMYLGRRLAGAGEGPVWDLCCGAGLDALGLARAGRDVHAVDQSPEALACTLWNAQLAGMGERVHLRLDPAERVDLADSAIVHVDPDRRATGRRAVGLAGCRPGAEFLLALPGRTAAGSVKLSPALDARTLDLPAGVGLEWISEAGVCRQLRLCWPAEAWGFVVAGSGPPRRATRLGGSWQAPQADSIQASLAPALPVAGLPQPGQILAEPDPAVVAAGAVDDLAAALGAARAAATLDWLVAPADLAAHPLARRYRVLAVGAARKAKVREAIRACGGGIVSIKTRGLKLDTDELARQLRGRGDRELVVFWGDLRPKRVAIVAERL